MKTKVILSILFFTSTVFSGYKYETILDNLDDAWSIVFLSEDRVLYTEVHLSRPCPHPSAPHVQVETPPAQDSA